MSDEEQLIAEQVVATDRSGSMTVRISQHPSEEFWRVDVSRDAGHTSTTVSDGDSFMMNLIQAAVSGEALAWQHLAHWGRDAMGRASRPAGLYA